MAREEVEQRNAETAEYTRSARGEVQAVHRLVAARGQIVDMRLRGVGAIAGTVIDVGQNWLLLEDDAVGVDRARTVLIPLEAVLSYRGLSSRMDARLSAASRRFDLRRAVREISRDRSTVQLVNVEGSLMTGTIDRVGYDHCDLADHAPDAARRAGEVRGHFSIPYTAIAMVCQL